MGIVRAIREDGGRHTEGVKLLIALDRHIRIGDMRFVARADAWISAEDLVKRREPATIGFVHLIDPESGAEVGRVWVNDDAPDLSMLGVRLSRLAERIESRLSRGDMAVSSLRLVHNILELGYRPLPSGGSSEDEKPFAFVGYFPIFDGDLYLLPLQIAARFSYGGAAYISYNFTAYHHSERREYYLVKCVLTISAEGRGAGRELADIALGALEPWRAMVLARVETEQNRRPAPGDAHTAGTGNASPARVIILPLRDYFPAASFLEKYIPEVAKRVKEYADEKLGSGQPLPAPA